VRALGAFLGCLVFFDVALYLLSLGPTQPPEWWTLFLLFGVLHGLAYLLHPLVYSLWHASGPYSLIVVIFILAMSIGVARATWRSDELERNARP
jgi:hypothetical protein